MNNEIPEDVKKILKKMAGLRFPGQKLRPCISSRTEDGFIIVQTKDNRIRYQWYYLSEDGSSRIAEIKI